MQYKTMILQHLRQRPEIHHQLKSSRTLLRVVEQYASELKANHEAAMEQLAQARPDSDPGQIASEALEMAMTEWMHSLPPESTPNEHEPLSLDAAMDFIRRHTPPA